MSAPGPTPRSPGLQLCRVAGIPVRVDFSWIPIFVLVLWSLSAGYFPRTSPGLDTWTYVLAGIAATLLFFGSILVHEISHAWIALRNGIHVPSITLFLFGGVAELEEDPHTPGLEAKVALIGPVASFALAAIFGLGYALSEPLPELARSVLLYLSGINVAIGVFNLLPGFPLDGGRVLRAILWKRRGSLQSATRTAADAGKGLALGVVLLGALQIFWGALIGGAWLILVGVFMRGLAESGYRGLVARHILDAQTVATTMISNPLVVPVGTTAQQLIEDYVLTSGHRAFPVVRGDDVLGLVRVDTLRHVSPESRLHSRVEDLMQPLNASLAIDPEQPLSRALEQMEQNGVAQLLVIREHRLRGLITAQDVQRNVELRESFAPHVAPLSERHRTEPRRGIDPSAEEAPAPR